MPTNPMETRPDDPAFTFLYDRRVAQEREAQAELDKAWPWTPANEIKQWLAGEAGKLNETLETAASLSRDGLDPEQVRTLRQYLVQQASERLDAYRDRIRKRFGRRTTLPELPVKDDDHHRFERILARLQLVYDKEDRAEYHEALRDAITEEVQAGHLAVVQELGALVDRERKLYRFDEFHEQHPMREAEVALELARTSKDTVLVELAEERLQRIEHELDQVGRTILEEGTWSGPRARTVFGPSSGDYRILDPAGVDETAARGDPTEAERLRELAKLPRQDPLAAMATLGKRIEEAGVKSEPPEERVDSEDAIRARIQTNEASYRAAHGLTDG